MKKTGVMQRILQRIDSYGDEIIRLQTALTALPALGPENGGEGEKSRAEFVKEILSQIAVDSVIELNAPDERVPCGYRPNLLAKIKGRSKAKTIWTLSHMDVVPPGELSLWESDPYTVRLEKGRIYGRGVEDNQQGMIASLLAVKALREENVLPPYDLGLALVADEETGNKYGLRYVLEQRRDEFRQEDIIIVPDSGDEEGTMIEIAEKSILWIAFRTIGKQCHGSRPAKGINAHKAAAHLIVRLNELYTLFAHSDPVFDPPTSTFEPTKKESNVPNINTIPGEDMFYFDCRILPTYRLGEVEAAIDKMAEEIESQFGVKVKISYPQREGAAPPTPVDAAVVKAITRALQDLRGKKSIPMGIGGGTVAALFRQAGLPAAVWETIDRTAHQPNEYCVIDNLIADARVFAHIFLQE